MDVLVIGAAGLDVKGQVQGPSPVWEPPGPCTISSESGRRVGPATSPPRIWARLGVEVALISAVGNDWAGRYLLEQARSAGIDTRHVPPSRTSPGRAPVGLLRTRRSVWPIVGPDDMAAIGAITLASTSSSATASSGRHGWW